MAEKYIWKKSDINFEFVNMDTVSGLFCGIANDVFYTSSDGMKWQEHPEIIPEDIDNFKGYWFPAMGKHNNKEESVICIPYSAWNVPDQTNINLVVFHYDTGLINYSYLSVPIAGPNLPDMTYGTTMFCTLLNPIVDGATSYLSLFGFPNFKDYDGNDNQVIYFGDSDISIPMPGPISDVITEWNPLADDKNSIYINDTFPFSSYYEYGAGGSVLFKQPIRMRDSDGTLYFVLGFDFSDDASVRLYFLEDSFANAPNFLISFISNDKNNKTFIVTTDTNISNKDCWLCQIVAGIPNGQGSNGFLPVFSKHITTDIGKIKGIYQTSSSINDLKIITSSGVYDNLGNVDENEIVPNEFLNDFIDVFQNTDGGIVALLSNNQLYVRQSANQTLTATLSYCTNDTTSPHTYTDLYPHIRLESILDYELAGAEFRVYTTFSSAKAIRASDGKTLTASTVNGVATIGNVGYGTWTVTAGSNTATIEVREFKRYKVFATLNDYSWEEISAVSQSGDAANLFSVGDTKSIVLNGTVGETTFSNVKIDAYILGINHNAEVEGNNRIHFCIGKVDNKTVGLVDSQLNQSSMTSSGYFSMSYGSSNTNSDGWKGCYMRNSVMQWIKNALPTDLQNVLKTVTKYTDNIGGGSNSASSVTATTETICLEAEFEVQGVRKYANIYEQNKQKQYDYYKNGNSKTRYKYNNANDTVYWWNRSPHFDDIASFCGVGDDGWESFAHSRDCYAVAPCFYV